MDMLDDLLNIGAIATRFISQNQIKGISKQQVNAYLREAALNKQIGTFNSEVANRTGMAAVQGIMHETSQLLSKQVNIMSNRGISLEGSPMLVLGETVAMGEKKAQEAMFNANVRGINHQFSAEIAAQHAITRAETANANAMIQSLNQAKTAVDSIKLLSSMGGGNPVTGLINGIGNIATGAISTIGKIFGSLTS